MSDGKDRRSSVRTQVVLKVDYVDPQLVLADYLTDLGDGGMFVRTSHPFEVGDHLGFVISFPGLVAPIELGGTVRWRRDRDDPDSEEVSRGVGVELEFADPDAGRRFQELLDRLRTTEVFRPMAEGKPFRVLLVEDNDFVQDLFQHAIRKFNRDEIKASNLEVITAADGQQAWKRLQEGGFDLAIVDHFLPVMSGVELIGRMRADERFRRTPVLVVSVGGEEVRAEAMQAGADLYLDKPVLLKQLITTLRSLVGES